MSKDAITKEATTEEVKQSLIRNFPDYKKTEWSLNRKVWLMGRIVCDLKGRTNPTFIMNFIEDYIQQLIESEPVELRYEGDQYSQSVVWDKRRREYLSAVECANLLNDAISEKSKHLDLGEKYKLRTDEGDFILVPLNKVDDYDLLVERLEKVEHPSEAYYNACDDYEVFKSENCKVFEGDIYDQVLSLCEEETKKNNPCENCQEESCEVSLDGSCTKTRRE